MSDLASIVKRDAAENLALASIEGATDVAAAVADNSMAALADAVGQCVGFLPVGSAIKACGQALTTYHNYRLFKKLGKFIFTVRGNATPRELDSFLESIADRDEEVSEYMLALLDKAESSDKARMMGIIYAAAAKNAIDIDTMLRLSAVVERGFVADFRRLPEFVEPHEDIDDAANTFINLGLIDNEPGGRWLGSPDIRLNELGKTLLDILQNGGWFDDKK